MSEDMEGKLDKHDVQWHKTGVMPGPKSSELYNGLITALPRFGEESKKHFNMEYHELIGKVCEKLSDAIKMES